MGCNCYEESMDILKSTLQKPLVELAKLDPKVFTFLLKIDVHLPVQYSGLVVNQDYTFEIIPQEINVWDNIKKAIDQAVIKKFGKLNLPAVSVTLFQLVACYWDLKK
jgi:hypothetical protein